MTYKVSSGTLSLYTLTHSSYRVHTWQGKTRTAWLQSGEGRMMIDSVVWAQYINVTDTPPSRHSKGRANALRQKSARECVNLRTCQEHQHLNHDQNFGRRRRQASTEYSMHLTDKHINDQHCRTAVCHL